MAVLSPEFVACVFVFSIALIVVSAAAYSFGLRWLQDRAAARAGLQLLAELERKIEEGVVARKRMGEMWKEKFDQLERDWKKLKEHADSQYTGALAQAASQARGFR